jgi:hypothetical protein
VSNQVIALVLIACGVPLYIWWLLQQRIRYPWRGRPSESPRREWLRRHDLTADEADEVASAVVDGRALADGRLRNAAAEWAEILLRTGRPHDPRIRRLLTGLLAVWVLFLVALLGSNLVRGRFEIVHWSVPLVWVSLTASIVGRRRTVRRSLGRNSARSEGK